MNYSSHYNRLIERARLRPRPEGYVESHHVIPRCLGGSDNKSNLVFLTAEEHYVAHQLLVKIYPGTNRLIYALWGMTGNSRGCKWYGWARKLHAAEVSSRMIGNTHNAGRKHTDETRAKVSEALRNRTHSEESKRKIAVSAIGNTRTLGMTHSEESKLLMGKKMKEIWAKRHSKGKA